MLTNRTLARIDGRPREVGWSPLLVAGVGTLVLAALAAMAYAIGILPSYAPLAVVGGGALVVLLLYARQRAKMTISLSYKDDLDEETAARFSEVRAALEGLSSSRSVWSISARVGRSHKGEAERPIPLPERKPARIGRPPTPGIKADVPVWGIEAEEGTIFFFPEGMLHYKNDRYVPVAYNALKMTLSSGRFFEEDDLPDDATVVETVWRFSRPDGSRDPLHKNDNVQIPVVLYSLLDINGPSGLRMRLMVSSRRAAARFARAFDAEDLREKRRKDSAAGAGKASGYSSSNGQRAREEAYRSAEAQEKEARLATARKTLGVAKGASAEEIGAVYRELARTHHPDKVAHLEPEVREYSEQRMKEINAAYAELRGRGGSVLRGRPA